MPRRFFELDEVPAYDEAIAKEILGHVMQGLTLNQACEMASRDISAFTFNVWVMHDVADIARRYAVARLLGVHAMADEIIDIADEKSNDWHTNDAGFDIVNVEAIQRAKLRIDARQWYTEKMLPKSYGKINGDETTYGGILGMLNNGGSGARPSIAANFEVAEPIDEVKVTRGTDAKAKAAGKGVEKESE